MHIIRLRSAWEPAVAGAMNGSQRCFERWFGRPTNLVSERVSLVIAPAPVGRVHLNEESLHSISNDESGEFRADVTSLLHNRNLLSIECDSAAFQHEVRLEIVE